MARVMQIASRLYGAGSYGPFAVDSFVADDVDWLELGLTVENWPVGTPLITGQLRWNTGDGADFTINSPPKNRDGTLKTVATVRVGVPQTADGKAAVTGGTVTMTLLQGIRTAVSLTAGPLPAV